MNKVILMGRLTKNPEVRYTGAENLAVARYTLAVNRRFQKKGEQEADFIQCIAFGKNGEFAEKYLQKGQLISVVGRLQVRKWDKDGEARWSTEVIVEEHYFAESKKETEKAANKAAGNVPDGFYPAEPHKATPDGFYPIDESIEDDDLPF